MSCQTKRNFSFIADQDLRNFSLLLDRKWLQRFQGFDPSRRDVAVLRFFGVDNDGVS